MNKTININLANTFFHIDEDAYNKLQRYLEAIKRSLANSQGKEEIIADIEARIAELFTEKLQHDRQVITHKEVDEIITVMGQPEDYMVDEEIFDDQPKQQYKSPKTKHLYRDLDDKYISGVSSGLGHYLGIDAVWIRLLWILLTFLSGGTFIFAYILFWILVPEAVTTSQKLAMKGEPVNISNIEKKIKEGFDDVADKVKNADYSKVKSSSKTFFDTLGDIIILLLKVFGKFIGIILLIVAATVLVCLFIGLFTAGSIEIMGPPFAWQQYFNIFTDTPIWLLSIFIFFAVGVPFFFLFYLGLKILVSNLKSIGMIAKFALLGIWILSIIGLIALGVRVGMQRAYNGYVSEKEELYVSPADTLTISMNEKDNYDAILNTNGFYMIVDDNGGRKLISKTVNFNIKKAEDSLTHIKIDKRAKGSSYDEARANATAINYNYQLNNNKLNLDDHSVSDIKNKFKDQQIDIDVFIPVGQVIRLDETTKYKIGYRTENDKGFYRTNLVEHYWKMGEDGILICMDCEDDENQDEDKNNKINIDENGIDINIKDTTNGDQFKMKIDEKGVEINTK